MTETEFSRLALRSFHRKSVPAWLGEWETHHGEEVKEIVRLSKQLSAWELSRYFMQLSFKTDPVAAMSLAVNSHDFSDTLSKLTHEFHLNGKVCGISSAGCEWRLRSVGGKVPRFSGRAHLSTKTGGVPIEFDVQHGYRAVELAALIETGRHFVNTLLTSSTPNARIRIGGLSYRLSEGLVNTVDLSVMENKDPRIVALVESD